MHDYMRAVGFSEMDKSELRKVIKSVIDEPKCEYATDGEDAVIAERSKDVGERIGITVCGEYDRGGSFVEEYYFPYLRGDSISLTSDVSVEKHADRDSYVGIVEQINLGVSLAFYLLNRVEYVDHRNYVKHDTAMKAVYLSALSISGKVLLPMEVDFDRIIKVAKAREKRESLMMAAKEGNEQAIENLTLEDIDLFSAVTKAAKTTDVLTLVETCFMPYSISCDEYSIVGNIVEVHEVKNKLTKEQLYRLKVECNGHIFDISINKKDLLGEPAPARRFRGVIWMQGYVEFATI